MSEYYGNGGFQYGDGSEENQQSSVYTYIPTEPIEPETIKKPEKKKKKKGGNVWKKLGVFLLCGVMLGGAGAGTFIGVMKASGYEDKIQKAIDAANQTNTPKVATAETTPTSTNSGGEGSSGSVADVAESAMPSIVAITNTQIYQNNDWNYFFGGGSQEVTGSGSGIIIGQNDKELLVLTNYHVIDGASSLKVTFIDDSVVDANVKGTAESNDLAVISIPLESLSSDTLNAIKIAKMGDSNSLRVGDEVIAIGNALGYGQSLTYGHVSALSRDVTIDSKTLTLLQTDAAINPGNSGGALLNMNGEVVGINSAKYSSEDVEGMGFAIPISEAEDIINDLMSKETRTAVGEDDASYLGIEGVAMDASNAKVYNMPEGIYVYGLVENGPAYVSGLKEKDIITAIEGTGVTTMDELKEQLTYYAGGTVVELTVQRLMDGEYQEQKISVALGYKKDYQSQSSQQPNTQQPDIQIPGQN
ncbi:trypsin-like peptidase domain-containing protein [Lacrimispora sp. NSJ-141]|uniref:Trypsin-like peptidase domain-containing protein n=1 Tax=Lientehia hominis TaxID=2897778 RepID=A0AAP2RJT8_9FIRM|nr:trypsin-like peptidase domain-containing protein [Lientehia hominis]MCD2492128.1 trypsin-like peptidase domain-containing protein [Lientehia hominis]